MSFGTNSYLKKKCDHRHRINKGTKNKPNIRCLRCDKKFKEKMYLYNGLTKFKVVDMDNVVIKLDGGESLK